MQCSSQNPCSAWVAIFICHFQFQPSAHPNPISTAQHPNTVSMAQHPMHSEQLGAPPVQSEQLSAPPVHQHSFAAHWPLARVFGPSSLLFNLCTSLHSSIPLFHWGQLLCIFPSPPDPMCEIAPPFIFFFFFFEISQCYLKPRLF